MSTSVATRGFAKPSWPSHLFIFTFTFLVFTFTFLIFHCAHGIRSRSVATRGFAKSTWPFHLIVFTFPFLFSISLFSLHFSLFSLCTWNSVQECGHQRIYKAKPKSSWPSHLFVFTFLVFTFTFHIFHCAHEWGSTTVANRGFSKLSQSLPDLLSNLGKKSKSMRKSNNFQEEIQRISVAEDLQSQAKVRLTFSSLGQTLPLTGYEHHPAFEHNISHFSDT